MKSPEEYLQQALQQSGVFGMNLDKIQIIDKDQALNALETCLRDHDEFVKETLERLNILTQQSKVIMDTLNEILSRQPSSGSDQSSSSELSFPS